VFKLKGVTCLTKQIVLVLTLNRLAGQANWPVIDLPTRIAYPRRYMQYTEYEAQKGWEKKQDSDVNA